MFLNQTTTKYFYYQYIYKLAVRSNGATLSFSLSLVRIELFAKLFENKKVDPFLDLLKLFLDFSPLSKNHHEREMESTILHAVGVVLSASIRFISELLLCLSSASSHMEEAAAKIWFLFCVPSRWKRIS